MPDLLAPSPSSRSSLRISVGGRPAFGEWFAALLCGLFCGGLLGCGGPPAGPSAPAGKTLIYVRAGESDRLDPINEDSGESVKVMVNIFETLVAYDEKSADLVPGLAERWTPSADGLTWTFAIRPDVRFHDGTPLTAQAVAYSFERLLDPQHPGAYDPNRPYAPTYRQDIAKVEATGPLEVRFTLKQPSAVFLANLAMFPASIVSPAAVAAEGKEFRNKPVGTGPFRFLSWERDQALTLAAFDGYWGGRPPLDRVVFVPVLEPAVRIEQLLRGEGHLVDSLPPAEFARLADRPELTRLEAPGMNVGYLGFQMEKAPYNIPEIRRAIAHAIDKKALIRLCFGGEAEAAVHPIPREMTGFHDDSQQDRTYDPDLARKLVAEGLEKAGLKALPKLELMFPTSARPYLPEPQKTATYIKEQAAKIGLEVVLVPVDIRQYFQRCSKGEHGMCLLGWSSDNADPDNFLYQLFDPDQINDVGGNNVSRYRNAEVQRLLAAARGELRRPEREKLYRQVQARIFADVPVVPLVHMKQQVLLRKEVRGYHLHPTGLVRLRRVDLVPVAAP